MEVDARATIQADLREGQMRVLGVTLNLCSERMTLAWVD